jgi:hypothetical protein
LFLPWWGLFENGGWGWVGGVGGLKNAGYYNKKAKPPPPPRSMRDARKQEVTRQKPHGRIRDILVFSVKVNFRCATGMDEIPISDKYRCPSS